MTMHSASLQGFSWIVSLEACLLSRTLVSFPKEKDGAFQVLAGALHTMEESVLAEALAKQHQHHK